MDINTKIDIIKSWSVNYNTTKYGLKRPFDTSFVESVEDWIQEHDPTQQQETAIDNIIEKFKIKV